jgi:hypothetical protein
MHCRTKECRRRVEGSWLGCKATIYKKNPGNLLLSYTRELPFFLVEHSIVKIYNFLLINIYYLKDVVLYKLALVAAQLFGGADFVGSSPYLTQPRNHATTQLRD